MPKLKFSDKVWERAQTLFELGKSLSEITKETGIDKSQLSKESNVRGWKKGFIQHVVTAKVQNIKENHEIENVISTLNSTQQRVIEKETERLLQGEKWYQNAARKVATATVTKLDDFQEGKDFASAAKALTDCMRIEKLVPFYPSQANVKVEVNNEKLDPLLSNAIRDAAKIIES